jgi:hypothetical protein
MPSASEHDSYEGGADVTRVESVPALSWFGRIRTVRDPELRVQSPRGKVRGKRGYYRALRRDAAAFNVKLRGPFDYMHWHVDWLGLGNSRWRARREHLQALFTTFARLIEETAAWTGPYQVWLQIDTRDGSQDAVYLHTPNDHSAFPNPFDQVMWDAPIPERLREFVTDPAWQFGRYEELWTHFVIRIRSAT